VLNEKEVPVNENCTALNGNPVALDAVTTSPARSSLLFAIDMAESSLNMECRLWQMVQFGKDSVTGEMILGEVLRIHVRDEFYRDGVVDGKSLRAVGRMGWAFYTRTTDLF